MKWVAFFSQTGQEIAHISKLLGIKPDLIVRDGPIKPGEVCEDILKFNCQKIEVNKVDSSFYHKTFDNYNYNKDVVITLHGWLKIVPKDVCEKYEIYNGHPGDVIGYPILKGKDPQKKAFDLKLPTSGVIIHRVTSDVDGGPIFYHKNGVDIKDLSLDEVYKTLKSASLMSWHWFFNSRLSYIKSNIK